MDLSLSLSLSLSLFLSVECTQYFNALGTFLPEFGDILAPIKDPKRQTARSRNVTTISDGRMMNKDDRVIGFIQFGESSARSFARRSTLYDVLPPRVAA